MPERIYTSTGDGKLEALEETRFPTEDELQALIAEHPELLDGEQIRPRRCAALGPRPPARRASPRQRVKARGGRSIT